jgi:hypothetical protein
LSLAPTGSTYASSISVFNGNLYFTNLSGVAVQITDGGAVITSPASAQTFQPQNVSSDLTISPSEDFVYLITTTTAEREITLPLANSVAAGRIYIIKDSSGLSNTNNITLSTQGSDTIDGETSQILNSNYGSWTVITDGIDSWYIS